MDDSHDFTKEQEEDYSDLDLLYQDQNEPLFDSSSYSFLSENVESIDGSPPTPQPPPLDSSSHDNYQQASSILISDFNLKSTDIIPSGKTNTQSNLNITQPSKNKTNIPNNSSYFLPNPKFPVCQINNSQPKDTTISPFVHLCNQSQNVQNEIPQLPTFSINPNQICFAQYQPQYFMNSRPCLTRSGNNIFCTCVKDDSSRCCLRTRMRGKQLPPNVQKFKYRFFSILSSKKKFRKKIVQEIHNNFLVKELGFKRMQRDEYRNISIYFLNYYSKKDEILNVLEKNKTQIKNQIQLP